MKIYDQATNLQARMKAAMDAEASDELISRGNTVREELPQRSRLPLGSAVVSN